MLDDVGPIISSRGAGDPIHTGLHDYQPPKGFARMVLEVPIDIATAATKRARRRRVPIGRVVEDALRAALGAEGVAVMLAAVVVGLGGCRAPAAPAPASGAVTLAEGLQWAYAMGFDAGRASKLERVNCGRLMLAGE